MSVVLPIAITILRCKGQYLFLKRARAPYEGLWSLIGGKVKPGEHIGTAASREVMEETGASSLNHQQHRGIVSERLVDANGSLLSHFLIFVGFAEVDRYEPKSIEGDLSLFNEEQIEQERDVFLPSDLCMFRHFKSKTKCATLCEAEMVRDNGYRLVYFRESRQ